MRANSAPSVQVSILRRVASVLVVASLGLSGCNLFVDADAHIERGREKLAAHDYRGAIIELRNALQSEPKNAQAQLALAEALLGLGDGAGARSATERALAAGATATAVAPLAAQASLDLREYRELLAQLDSGALRLEPAAESLYRGLAQLGLRELEAAAAAFEQALELDRGALRARLGLAEAQIARGQLEAANRELDKVIAAAPGNARAWLIRGGLHAKRGDYEAAERALLKAQARASAELPVPQQVGLLALLTEIRLARGELDAARASQGQLVQLSGNAPVARVLAGRLALAARDYAGATEEFQRALVAAPNFVTARFLLGSTLAAQGSLNQAEAELARVTEQAPENFEARRLLARVRLQLDRPDAALQALESEDAEPETGSLALDVKAAAGPGNPAQADRDLKLEAARVHLLNKDANRALALLQQMPAVSQDLRREGLLLAALIEARGASAAEAELGRWLAAQPRDAALRELAAVFHAQRKEPARARAEIEAAIALNSKEARIFVTAARVEYAGGNPTAAVAHLEKALALEPNNASAHIGLAELALRAGDLATAERRLEAYRALDAKATAPRLLLAKVKLQRKDPAAADRVLREAIAAAPKNAAVRLAAGNVYATAGRYDEAVAQFKTAAQLAPNDPAARLDLARGQSALGQAGAARESLEAALRLKPDWPAAVGALALLDLREGGRERAARRIDALERKRPNDAAVAMLAGDVATSLADYPKAAAAYARAAGLEPTTAAAIKGYRARRLGQLADSAQPLESWLAQRPEDPASPAVRMLLAEFRAATGNTAEAIAEYERLIAIRPTPAALNNLAWVYHKSGDRRALETAKRAYTLAPKAAAIVDTYGWILLESGDIAAGAAMLKEATELDRNDPDISYHYAAALSRRGDEVAAKARLAKLLERPKDFSTQADARRLFEELSRRP